jgi:putative effector of murein hydrolase LrgA (UPF0299 family)
MIANLSLILLCQLAGEIFVRGLGLLIPGPVIGLVLLFLALIARDHLPVLARGPLAKDGVEGTAKGMLQHLSLLFVPAGVGVVQQLNLIQQHGIAIFIILALSAFVTLAVTVSVFILANRVVSKRRRTP